MLTGLVGAVLALEASGPPILAREFRGVWVATVDNIDWPSSPGLSSVDQKTELARLLRSVADLRFNAVVFQVRPSADAVYKSRLEPSSWYLTGEQGSTLEFDPLEYCVEEAHRLGLEVHAWFNPFRACHPAQKGSYSASHVSQEHPDWIVDYAGYKWMNPGLPETREHSHRVFMDVVQRYDIDGVHIDDYFYPYPSGDTPFPDEKSYKAYRTAAAQSLLDWRRSNVDLFVQRLYKSIKAKKPWVKFGISPFGIYRPGVPTGIKAGVDQYDDLAADALKWLRNGWCDYMSPQLYWKIDSTGQPFGKLLNWWTASNTKNRHLWPGLYTSLLMKSWTPDEIENQVKLIRKSGKAGGAVHFSAIALTKNAKRIRAALGELYAEPALVPASPWLGKATSTPPMLKRKGANSVEWAATEHHRFYAAWEWREGKWHWGGLSSVNSYTFGSHAAPDRIAIVGVSQTGQASPPLIVSIRN